MTPKRAKRRSEADFWAQISITFPREFRRPIKFALLRPAPFFEAENRRPREGDSFDRSSPAARDHKKSTENGKVRYSLCSRKFTRKLETHIYSLGISV